MNDHPHPFSRSSPKIGTETTKCFDLGENRIEDANPASMNLNIIIRDHDPRELPQERRISVHKGEGDIPEHYAHSIGQSLDR